MDSIETTSTKENKDFIADDSIQEKYILTAEEFKNLIKNTESLDYLFCKNNEYMVKLPGGKKVHFGSPKYEDFIIHKDKDKDKRDKYILTGEEFKKLIKSAKNLGAESLDYSSRKNNKYMVKLPGGKKVHFGSSKCEDYTIHKDKDLRDKYLYRVKNIKNKQGELTYNNPESPNFWSTRLLWSEE